MSNLNSQYNADSEIEKSLRNLSKNGYKAEEISGVNTGENVTAITFEGMVDQKTTKKLLALLKSYDVKSTFFLPGIKAAEDPDTVKAISDAGQVIGNYTLNADTHMERFSQQEMVKNFCRTNVILGDISGKAPSLLKCSLTEYSDSLLKSAYASGLKAAVDSNYFLNYQSFSSQEVANNFVKNISKGSIISIKMNGILDQSEYEKGKKTADEKPGITPKSTLTQNKKLVIDQNEKLVEVVGYLLNALQKNNYKLVPVNGLAPYKGLDFTKNLEVVKNQNKGNKKALFPDKSAVKNNVANNTLNLNTTPGNYEAMRILNTGHKAELVTKIYTSQPSVCYIFRGISNKEVLDSVLQELDALHAKATFFVTGKELVDDKANVDEIVKRGYQICNGGYGIKNHTGKSDFDAACYDIDMGERCLKAYLGSNYSDKENKYYMPYNMDANAELLEAAKTLGYNNVISYNISPVSEKFKNLSASEIIKVCFANTVALQRGDIVYFRLDYLTQKDAIRDLVYETAVKYIKKAPYDISSVGDMLTSNLVYVPASRAQAKGSDLIKTTNNFPEQKLLSMITSKYIGNPCITTSEDLIGFSDEEIAQVDKTGKVNTNGEKVIFLTFDDWGYDDNITRLLNVLKKYNVKATFFVRVGNDNLSYDSPMPNPNLLRAIALDGHDIGCHTFTHMKVDIKTEAEQALLQKDIVTAHQEMARYIGDTGNLKLYFRPPTLAVSKLGLETVFNCGYQYIVNGDFDPHDYEANSAQQLINRLINGISIIGTDPDITPDTPPEDILKIGPGSIVVMHMLENAQYTAEALDTVIPYYLEKGYRFAKLSDYLK
ncbi:polysaccharide deacetylase family protein [Desulfosporosinus sp. SYSU MS00001]|uniref:polysaccharide deacetylase family protein n=1 Tax=Desulfosporosinus sp. SYSU MS00001 TaxID=3416284 RepID=UPI003CEB8EAD